MKMTVSEWNEFVYMINYITNTYFIVFTSWVTTQVHLHEGRLIRVPPEFNLPKKSNVKDVFIHWHKRDTVNGVPPLKELKNSNVKHIKWGPPVFSDLRYLMAVLEKFAIDEGITTVGISGMLQAIEMFCRFSARLYVFETKNISRREQFKWQTWVKKFRKAKACTVYPVHW